MKMISNPKPVSQPIGADSARIAVQKSLPAIKDMRDGNRLERSPGTLAYAFSMANSMSCCYKNKTFQDMIRKMYTGI